MVREDNIYKHTNMLVGILIQICITDSVSMYDWIVLEINSSR
jgi:hypothetical protein